MGSFQQGRALTPERESESALACARAMERGGCGQRRKGRGRDKDRYKDTQLQLMGLRVMRVSDFRWDHDRPAVVGEVLAMLARGGWSRRRAN